MSYLKQLNTLKSLLRSFPIAPGAVVTTNGCQAKVGDIWIVSKKQDFAKNSEFYVNFPPAGNRCPATGASMSEYRQAIRTSMDNAVALVIGAGYSCRTPIEFFPGIDGRLHICASSGGMYIKVAA